jgi:hypothetical protein
MKRLAALPAGLFILLASAPLSGGEVGEQAPSIVPSEWLNVSGPMSWSRLKGRVVLIENWATW